MKSASRWFLLFVLLGVLAAWGCDDGEETSGEDLTTPDVQEVEEVAPLEDQPISIELSAETSESLVESYEHAGEEYEVEIEGAYLVAGNFSVLAPGEPVPDFTPDSGDEDPLSLGARSLDGYQVVDLLEGTTFGPLMVPGGWAGPGYFGIIVADRSADPLEGESTAPEIADATLFVGGRIRSGELIDKEFVLRVAWEQLVVFGAPTFDATAPRNFKLVLDMKDWFGGIEVLGLSHTANVIRFEEGKNIEATEIIKANAVRALSSFTLTVD